MSKRRHKEPEQLPLPTPPSKRPVSQTPEQIAKGSIARRAKPSPVPGNVMLPLRLDLKQELAERLIARAIRKGVNIEAIEVDMLRAELGE